MTDAPLLKSQRFRQAREADWSRLEKLMKKAESGSPSNLTHEEILAIPVLYRSALSSLSVARETSLDQGLIEYLETLTARAYFFVYGSRETMRGRLVAFFQTEWSTSVRSLWRETLVVAALMFLAAGIAYGLVMHDAEWFYTFAPEALSNGRDPSATTEALRETLSGTENAQGLTAFSTQLFTHNVQVCLLSFAVGFALCLPTALLVMYNGALLGAFVALFASRGLGVELGGWLLIHGVTELFAIVLAGAAGMKIGWAVIFPGRLNRLDAITQAGRTAGTVMCGVIVMLMLAGLLEGFGRQLIDNTIVRYTIAGVTGLIWALYFYAPRRRAPRVS